MRYYPASRFDIPTLTRFWNLGYTGYFTPVTFTEEFMANWLRWGDYNLERSVVLMDSEELVGFSMLGTRGKEGWIGGFGVAPNYRGQGHSYQIFAHHMSRLSMSDLTRVRLEVLTQNWARKVYEKVGFKVIQRFLVLRGALNATGSADVQIAGWQDLLKHSDRLHAEHPACWQREPLHLLKQVPAHAIGIYTGPADAPTGMAIAVQDGNVVRLSDAAATAEAAPGLVASLAAHFPGATFTLLNEPESSPMASALKAAGLEEAMSQYDMHWHA